MIGPRFLQRLSVLCWSALLLSCGNDPSGRDPGNARQAANASAGAPAAEAPPPSQLPAETRAMPFDACSARIDEMVEAVRSTRYEAVPVVETDIMRTVRFPANDGSVLVTCSRPDERMVLVHSPQRH